METVRQKRLIDYDIVRQEPEVELPSRRVNYNEIVACKKVEIYKAKYTIYRPTHDLPIILHCSYN